jgi:hypothetical protein
MIGSLMTPFFGRSLILTLSIGASLCGYRSLALAAEEPDLPCEAKLSKKAKMIYDIVLEKKERGEDLKEFSKEVTRDLITENRISKEEATISVKEALNCLVGRTP